MIGNKGIKECDEKQDQGTYPKLLQCADQIGCRKSEKAHLRKSIKGDSDHFVICKEKANPVEKFYGQGVRKWMVIAVRDKSQDLLILIDAVWCHDTWILIKKIGKPAEQTKEEAAKTGFSAVQLLKKIDCPG